MIHNRRKRHVVRLLPQLNNNMWVWRNWIKNNYRKASEIDFSHNSYCPVLCLKTTYGQIFSLADRSGIVNQSMKNAILELYRLSGEEPPIFVNVRRFKQIEAMEHGNIHPHL